MTTIEEDYATKEELIYTFDGIWTGLDDELE